MGQNKSWKRLWLTKSSIVRRRDSLVALLAAVNRSIFWFHPLAWWMECKLSLLAEQACDEALRLRRLGADRDRYARLLIEMAGAVEAARGRVLRHACPWPTVAHETKGSKAFSTPVAAAVEPDADWLGGAPRVQYSGNLRRGGDPARTATAAAGDAVPHVCPPSAAVVVTAHAPAFTPQPRRKNQGEYDLAAMVHRESDPQRKLEMLNLWKKNIRIRNRTGEVAALSSILTRN